MVGIEEEKTQHVNCAPWSSPLLDPGSFPRGVQKVIYCFLTCVVVVVVVDVVGDGGGGGGSVVGGLTHKHFSFS